MAVAAGPNIVEDGLLLCLDVANSKSHDGSTPASLDYWNDLVNDNNLQHKIVPVYSTDNLGQFQFDGLNDHMSFSGTTEFEDTFAWTADNTIGSNIFSWEIWIRCELDDNSGQILSKAWNGSGRYNYYINSRFFTLLVGTGVPDGPDEVKSITYSSNIHTGNWTQLYIYADSTNMGYKINGASITGSQAHTLTGGASDKGNANVPLSVMTLYPYGTSWVGNTGHARDGDLAILRRYNKVLSDAEIKQNYIATKSRFGL